MDRYIGLDAHQASCTLAVISEAGKRLRDFPVETNGAALVEAVRAVPGRRHLIFEEGTQSAWLYETLERHVEEIVVTGVTRSRGPKSDRGDAYALAEKLRIGAVDKPVFKAPTEFTDGDPTGQARADLRRLRAAAGIRDQAQPGQAHAGTQDCRDRVVHVEGAGGLPSGEDREHEGGGASSRVVSAVVRQVPVIARVRTGEVGSQVSIHEMPGLGPALSEIRRSHG